MARNEGFKIVRKSLFCRNNKHARTDPNTVRRRERERVMPGFDCSIDDGKERERSWIIWSSIRGPRVIQIRNKEIQCTLYFSINLEGTHLSIFLYYKN